VRTFSGRSTQPAPAAGWGVSPGDGEETVLAASRRGTVATSTAGLKENCLRKTPAAMPARHSKNDDARHRSSCHVIARLVHDCTSITTITEEHVNSHHILGIYLRKLISWARQEFGGRSSSGNRQVSVCRRPPSLFKTASRLLPANKKRGWNCFQPP